MSRRLIEKSTLSAKGLLANAKDQFKKIAEPLVGNQGKAREISIADCCMSALAMFKLKFPSLLQFDSQKEEKPIKANIKNLFKVSRVPCDTYMRERLDDINPRDLRSPFKSIFAKLQRGKVLEKYKFLNGKLLMLNDGTGYFSSSKIHCDNCCTKNHKNGSITHIPQVSVES
ncbi:hypothetical protein [Candidatus Neptunochlamydia vexilliferae]|uniref:Uncharacterized protein n=1 Tax=Candidatus Neptunichlamydia vexilliferae TaxID=1651774 RepID=A0ABS0AYP0_9BACT|nr:hypothetical protein [Candidatus Neptunochlamydia vexilliferae]MBF5059267.1 hypothetical protein [Candidatus Neptunochlamydia vexilliferae]